MSVSKAPSANPSAGATGYLVRVSSSNTGNVDYTLTLAQALCPGNAGACGGAVVQTDGAGSGGRGA